MGTNATPLQLQAPTTTSASATQALRDALHAGRWSPGEALRQEELATELGVSRVPVREALFQLHAEGLVVIAPNRGAYAATFSQGQLQEIFHLRALLETDVLRRAIPHHDKVSLDRLQSIQRSLRGARDVTGWAAGDREFHEALYEPSGRTETLALVRRLRSSVERYYVAYMRPRLRDVKWNEEHDLLIDAVRRRRTDRAVSLLKHHLAETEKCVLSALKHSTPRTSP